MVLTFQHAVVLGHFRNPKYCGLCCVSKRPDSQLFLHAQLCCLRRYSMSHFDAYACVACVGRV